MRNVLTYSLGPVPWALAYPDGSLTKTMKSKLVHLLEENTPSLESVPAGAAVLIDGMALLHCLSSIPATFGKLAEKVFKQITRSLRAGGSRVDFVTDQYSEISIKGAWRATTAGRCKKRSTSYKCHKEQPAYPQAVEEIPYLGRKQSLIGTILCKGVVRCRLHQEHPWYTVRIAWQFLYKNICFR